MALHYAKIIGQFITLIADTTDDLDEYPDPEPLSGTITFTASPKAVLIPGAVPNPVTALPAPIVVTLDQNGYVSLNGLTDVFVLATDDPSTNPTGFTYSVAFNLSYNGVIQRYGPINIAAPTWNGLAQGSGGNAVDLTLAAPVPTNGGTAIVQGPPGATGPAGPQGPAGPSSVSIDDANTNTTHTWSSTKITAAIAAGAGSGSAVIDDTATSTTKAWSAAKIISYVGTAPTNATQTRRQNTDLTWPLRGTASPLVEVVWEGLTPPPETTGYALAGTDAYDVLDAL
jgi:hypothetical protein